MLNVIDEFTHECLAIRIARKLKAIDVIDVLSDLFILRGIPGHIRSHNGPEFVAKAVQDWIAAVGAKIAYIARGSPWENGYIESFNARLRDELLNGETRLVSANWSQFGGPREAFLANIKKVLTSNIQLDVIERDFRGWITTISARSTYIYSMVLTQKKINTTVS